MENQFYNSAASKNTEVWNYTFPTSCLMYDYVLQKGMYLLLKPLALT